MMRIYGCQFDLTVAPFVCRTELTNKDKNVTLWNIKNINLGLLKLVGFSKAQFVEATCAFCLQYLFLDHPLRWNTKKKKKWYKFIYTAPESFGFGAFAFRECVFLFGSKNAKCQKVISFWAQHEAFSLGEQKLWLQHLWLCGDGPGRSLLDGRWVYIFYYILLWLLVMGYKTRVTTSIGGRDTTSIEGN